MDYKFVKTTCPYCGCGCQMILETLNGELIGTMPYKMSPMNQGKLCIKGWNAHEFVRSPNRLTTPLVRKDGVLQEASWDEALDVTVSRLREIKDAAWRGRSGFPIFRQMHQRRKLSAPENMQGGVRHEQRRRLRPSLTRGLRWQVLPSLSEAAR